jgi:hypothetical protein
VILCWKEILKSRYCEISENHANAFFSENLIKKEEKYSKKKENLPDTHTNTER